MARQSATRWLSRVPVRTIVLGALFPIGVAVAGIIYGATRAPPPPCLTPDPALQGERALEAPPCPGVIDPSTRYVAVIETTMGTIRFELLPQIAADTVNNFVFLARNGFYDGLRFHRIESTDTYAYVQTGDPTGGGKGNAGYTYEGETPSPITLYIRGSVAMANTGDPSSNSSQFFIVVHDWDELGPPEATPNYTWFGAVDDPESLATLDRIAAVPTEGTRPLEDVVIRRVTIVEPQANGVPGS